MSITKNEKEINDRLQQQFGNFCEHFVMYYLGRYKKMKVALVDQCGADIIASKDNKVYAISVKGRQFINDSDSFNFDKHNIKELSDFVNTFLPDNKLLIPVLSIVFINFDKKSSQPKGFGILSIPLTKIEELSKRYSFISNAYHTDKKTGNKQFDGYTFNFNSKFKENDIKNDFNIDYYKIDLNPISDNFLSE